jgi:protein-S-isoprenylcysteine O-methyltransferase Ste14
MIAPRFAFSASVGAVVYLVLAVIAEGGWAAYISHPPLVALAVAFLALTFGSFFTNASLSPGVREDRRNRWVLTAFGIIGTISAFVPPYTDRKDFWTFGGETVRWIGVAIFVLGGILRLWPVFVLGSRFSGLVAIQPGHKLVTTGIYRIIRHPSYLGLLINPLGWAIAFRSTIGLILTALLLIPTIARIRSEEALLLSQFGSEYESYRARTSRLIPGIY